MSRRASWHGRAGEPRLHVVTGKGGTGKTTVAAALALALAGSGRTVLLVEVEERQGISQVFDVPPLGADEVPVAVGLGGGQVTGLSVEAGVALVEYLRIFYRLGRAGDLLHRLGAIEFATTIAPGVRDVLLGGKVYEAVRRTTSGRHTDTTGRGQQFAYDAVVLDAPPTGRVGRFLEVTEHLADLARVGPIRGQAEAISTLLHSSRTVVHVVTLLEAMPVQETADAVAELSGTGLQLGAVVVNAAAYHQEQTDGPSAADPVGDLQPGDLLAWRGEPEPAIQAMSAHLDAAGVRPTPALLDGLWRTGQEAAEQAALETELTGSIEALGRPVLWLPRLSEGVGPDAVRQLAWSLHEQGVQAGGPQ